MISIPIIALNNLISTIICFLSLRKVYADHKQNPQNPILKDFVWFYVFFGLFFVTLSLPGLVLKDTTSAGAVSAISPFFLYMSIGYFIKIPLELSNFKEVKNILFVICMFLAMFLPLITIPVWQPAVYQEFSFDNFKVYALTTFSAESSDISWLRLLTGGGAVEAALVASVLLFINGIRSQDSSLKKKMVLMAIGMITLMGASIFSYIINYLFQVLFLPQLIASILAWIGLLIMSIGILYIGNIKLLKTEIDHNSD